MSIKHTFLVLVISGDSEDEVVTVLGLDALCLDTMSETFTKVKSQHYFSTECPILAMSVGTN